MNYEPDILSYRRDVAREALRSLRDLKEGRLKRKATPTAINISRHRALKAVAAYLVCKQQTLTQGD